MGHRLHEKRLTELPAIRFFYPFCPLKQARFRSPAAGTKIQLLYVVKEGKRGT